MGGYTDRDVFLACFDRATGGTVERVDFDEGTGVIVGLCRQVHGD